mgnify:FL=1
MKKGIAVLLAALMLASVWLVGCGERSPEELWATAKENIVTAKSARLHMTMDMAFDLQGETTSMTMKMDEACTQDPLSAEVNMTMDMGGLGKMDTTMYLVQEGKEYVSYTKVSGGILGDEDVGWSQSTIDVTDLKQYNAMDNAKLYLDVLNSFQSAGKEAIGSYNTIRYDGKVTGQDISKMLDTLGDNVSSMLSPSDASTMADLFSQLDGIPMSVWIDQKTALPVRYEMDLSGMVNQLMSTMINALSSLSSEAVDFQVSKARVTVECSDYNAVAPITVPQEVLDAATSKSADAA